jgi:hypothetical protein
MVEAALTGNALVIMYHSGVTSYGKAINGTQVFNNINNLTDEEIFNLGLALMPLYGESRVSDIGKRVEYTFIQS